MPSPFVSYSEYHEASGSNYGFGESLWHGARATIGSAAISAYNSVNWMGSKALGYDYEEVDIADKLRSYDDDMAAYYNDHQQGIDTLGFLIGSFVPGGLAVKVTKGLQAGKWGAAGTRVTGLMASKRDDVIKNALEEIKYSQHGVNATVSAAKTRAGVMGLKDNLVQSIAAEGAILATFNQSSIFDNMDTSDMAWNSVIGIGLGTGIGAGIDYFRNSGILKKAVKTREGQVRPFEPTGNLGAGNYVDGDRIVSLLNAIDEIPEVKYASSYASLQANVKAETSRNLMQTAQKLANDMAGGDAGLGKGLLDTIVAGRAKGAAREDAYDFFGNLVRIERVTPGDRVKPEVFYLNRHIDPANPPKQFSDIMSSGPIDAARADLAYTLNPGQYPTIGYVGLDGVKDIADGYKRGYDIIIDPKMAAHVNPNTSTLRRVPRPGENQKLGIKESIKRKEAGIIPEGLTGSIVVDLYSGAHADEAVATISDLFQMSESRLANGKNTLVSGDGTTIAKMDDVSYEAAFGSGQVPADFDVASLQARWALAEKRGLQDGDIISPEDIPFMVKAHRQGAIGNSKVALPPNLEDEIEKAAANVADTMIASGRDMDEIAHILNVPKKAIESLDFSWGNLSKYWNDPNWMAFLEKPRYAKATYKIGQTQLDPAGMVIRGMAQVQGRIKLIEETNQVAAATFFGKATDLLSPIELNHLRNSASSVEGAGAGFVTSAEGNYGSIASQVQQIGAAGRKFAKDLLDEATARIMAGNSQEIITNQAAATEYGLFAHAIQSAGENFKLVRDAAGKVIGAAYGPLADALSAKVASADDFFNQARQMLADGKTAIPDGFILNPIAAAGEKRAFISFNNPAVAAQAEAHFEITSRIAGQTNLFYASQGISRRIDPSNLYFAPADTSRFQHFAFVIDKQGIFGASDSSKVGAVFGESLDQFERNLARIDTSRYEIVRKGDAERFHQAKGDYDYSLAMNDNTTNAYLKRVGVLAEYYPKLNGKELIERQLEYYRKGFVRNKNNFLELKYARQFEELRTLGDAHTQNALSLMRRTAKGFEATVDDPFRSYIKTALDMSRLNEHRLWADSAEKADAFFSSAFRKTKEAFNLAAENKISFTQANDMAEQAGLGRVYENMASSIMGAEQQFAQFQQTATGRQVLTKFVTTANSVLATLALRLDAANSIINTISMPVLMGPELRSIMKHIQDPAIIGKLGDQLSYAVPGGNNRLPTATKLVMEATKNFFGSNKAALMQKYRDAGFIRDPADLYHNLLDEIAITGYETPKKLMELTNSIVEKGAKLTGSNWAEDFNRFISANVMDQLTTAAGLDAKTSLAYMNTFVNRVNGIYVASQRPVLFQGPVGQAIGLFQTYQFNLMQNVFRHFQNGDKKSAAMLFGLQSSIFGLQGLPGFHIINDYLVGTAKGNPEHEDLFSTVPKFMLYGSASWLSDSSLFTRGDITPRNLTVVPMPWNAPIVTASAAVINNGINFFKNLGNGAGAVESALFAIEHNGVNRPLAGIAASMAGETTTSKGTLVAKNLDILSWDTALRAVGAKPMDEAVALEANYRMLMYQAHDKALRESLGRAVKLKLLAGDEISDDEAEALAANYAKYGGTQQGFNRWMVALTKGSEESVVNKLMGKVNTPYGRRMQEIMGGIELPDYQQLQDNQEVPVE